LLRSDAKSDTDATNAADLNIWTRPYRPVLLPSRMAENASRWNKPPAVFGRPPGRSVSMHNKPIASPEAKKPLIVRVKFPEQVTGFGRSRPIVFAFVMLSTTDAGVAS
jgi:hypothetical protein